MIAVIASRLHSLRNWNFIEPAPSHNFSVFVCCEEERQSLLSPRRSAKSPGVIRHALIVTYFTNALYNPRMGGMPGKCVVIPRRSCTHNIRMAKHPNCTNWRLAAHQASRRFVAEKVSLVGGKLTWRLELKQKPFATHSELRGS